MGRPHWAEPPEPPLPRFWDQPGVWPLPWQVVHGHQEASSEHPEGAQAPRPGDSLGGWDPPGPPPSPHLLTQTILGHSCGGTWGGHSGPRIETLRSPPGCLGQGGTGDRNVGRRGNRGAKGDDTERQKHPERDTMGRWGHQSPSRVEPAGQAEGRGHEEAAGSCRGGYVDRPLQLGCPGTPASWFPLMCPLTFHLTSCPSTSGSLGDCILLSPGPHITWLSQVRLPASVPRLLWGVRV